MFSRANTADMYCLLLRHTRGVYNFRWSYSMAEKSLNFSGETPTKSSASNSSRCLLCGTEQNDSRKKTSLKGKVQDLAKGVAIILDIEVTAIDVEQGLNNR